MINKTLKLKLNNRDKSTSPLPGTVHCRQTTSRPYDINHPSPLTHLEFLFFKIALQLFSVYTPLNRLQSFTWKVNQMREAYSTASPISLPCLPNSRSMASSSYSPLM